MQHPRSLAIVVAGLALSAAVAWSQVDAPTPTPTPPAVGTAVLPAPVGGRVGRIGTVVTPSRAAPNRRGPVTGTPVAPAPAPAQPTADATPLPAAAAPMDPFAKDLLTRLSSPDAGQRSAAEDQIKSLTALWNQPEVLQKMVDTTTDPELKDAIQQRLNEVKNHLAMLDLTHLPDITLRVSGASIQEVCTELSKALGAPNALQPLNGGGGGGGYTLDVKNKPFWEVFAALSEQQPLNLLNVGTGTAGLRVQNGGMSIRNYAISGPVFAYFTTLSYRRSISLQNPNGATPAGASLMAPLQIGVDPRIQVARIATPTGISVTDDTGRKIPVTGSVSMAGSNFTNLSLNFNLPDTFGKSMNVDLDLVVSAAAATSKITIDDLENNVGKQVAAGGRTLTLTRFAVTGNQIGITISTLNAPGVAVGPARGVGAALAIPVVLLDGRGQQLWSFNVQGSVGASVMATGGPYKLEIRAADKTVDIPVHLSFKDVPLP